MCYNNCMKRILFIIMILFVFLSCEKKNKLHESNEAITLNEPNKTTPQNDISIMEISEVQKSETQKRNVPIPCEIPINNIDKVIIRDGGIIEYFDKVILYNEFSNDSYRENNILLRTYEKNNLLGINFIEQHFTGGVVGYTLVINKNTKKEVIFINDGDILDMLYDYTSIDNKFILVYTERAYAFDNSTGELLWTQTFHLGGKKRLIFYNDYFIIDDEDGNRYRIHGDGRKEKV